MADNSQNGDLVNLDEAMQGPTDGAGSGDTIINAAEIFQQQLEQMTTWKTQLSQQMDHMRRDGLKLLERQKTLAQEKTRLAEERTQLGDERTRIQAMQAQFEAEGRVLVQRAGELEEAQGRLAELQHQREVAERELVARQKHLAEQEALHLAEDVRLREGMEQLEDQRRHLAQAQRQAGIDREKLDAQAQDLAARAQALEAKSQTLDGRELDLAGGRKELEQAQQALQAQREELSAREQALAQKLRTTEEELQTRAAALVASERQLAADREAATKLRQELQKRVETFEQEQAEQLDTMAKQTKRLNERRAAVEAAENDLEGALAAKIAQATEALKKQLAQAGDGNQERIAELEQQLSQTEANATSWQAREAQFQADLQAANNQLANLTEELRKAGASLEGVSAERTSLVEQLEKQIEQGKAEAAKWQEALDAAKSQSAGGNQELEEIKTLNVAMRKEYKKLKTQYVELQKAKDELEFQLEVRKEELPKELETVRQELTREIAQRDAEIVQWKQKYETAQSAQAQSAQTAGAGKSSPQGAEKIKELARQIQMLEQQRNDIAAQLFAVQDALKHEKQESLLSKNVMEGKLFELEEKYASLEAEKSTWVKQQSHSAPLQKSPQSEQSLKQEAWHRERLLRQAKALRTFRQQIRDTQTTLETSRAEIAQQREQFRARKENLEQVKRLLEKQEMVMARKLADHNAIKTVAAVGIFVIMVLGSVFFGVYHFVRPVYRSEAVVQLAAPQDLQGAALDGWLRQQMEFMRTNEVTFTAWKILRSADEHYAMHDVRDEWLGTLSSHLNLTLDGGSKTMSIKYSGQDAEGVSQVCNAMATAYATPGMRDSTSSETTKALGLGSQVLAKATMPLYPVEDNRMMVSMSIVAIVMFVSLLLVMIFRHFIARQLKEIDQMADSKELEEMESELPEGAKAAM